MGGSLCGGQTLDQPLLISILFLPLIFLFLHKSLKINFKDFSENTTCNIEDDTTREKKQ